MAICLLRYRGRFVSYTSLPGCRSTALILFFKLQGCFGVLKERLKNQNKRRCASMNSRTVKYLSALFLCLLVVMSLQLRAQVTGATLSGTITDAQGGVVPNAN